MVHQSQYIALECVVCLTLLKASISKLYHQFSPTKRKNMIQLAQKSQNNKVTSSIDMNFFPYSIIRRIAKKKRKNAL